MRKKIRDAIELFPAHAGVILGLRADSIPFAALPRTRGGDPGNITPCVPVEASSPRMRG